MKSNYSLSPQLEAALAVEPGGRLRGKPFRMTSKHAECAALIAEGCLTLSAIAEKVGISRRTLDRWTADKTFSSKVAQFQRRIATEFARISIANRMRRLEALDRRHRKMSAVIEERAADPKMQDVPGGDTGLLVHRVKSIGKGKHSRTIDLYHVDAALLKEMREIEKQAAIETGQWGEKMALVEDDPQASPNHYSIKDKRAFIIQILAELGCNISPADLEEGIHANQPPQLTAPVPKTPIIGY